VRQKLANRLLVLERVSAAALAAMRNRERCAQEQATVDELKKKIEAWRPTNSGPEHKNESLMETWARSLGMTPRELHAQLMERACGGGLR
jgi:hypothetical protein